MTRPWVLSKSKFIKDTVFAICEPKVNRKNLKFMNCSESPGSGMSLFPFDTSWIQKKIVKKKNIIKIVFFSF